MLIGYAHVSATDQSPQLQLDALTKEGCTKIFTDTISDAKRERPGLTEALSYVRRAIPSWSGSWIASAAHCKS